MFLVLTTILRARYCCSVIKSCPTFHDPILTVSGHISLFLTNIFITLSIKWNIATSFSLTKISQWIGNICFFHRLPSESIFHAYLSFFFLNYSWLIISSFISAVEQWFNIFMHYKMINTVSPVTICVHTKLLQYYWLYSLCCTLHPYDLFIL